MSDAEHIKILVIKEFTGKISPEEKTLLQHLISKDADAKAYYHSLRGKFTRPDVMQAIEDLDQDITFETTLEKSRKKRRILPLRIAGAAVVILVTLGIYSIIRFTAVENKPPFPLNDTGITLTMPNGRKVDLSAQTGQVQVGNVTLTNSRNTLSYSGNNQDSSGFATLNVPAGKDYAIQLSDGTEIQLNSASSITFPFAFSGQAREITISGEAYFKITRNATMPFLVHIVSPGEAPETEGAMIRVLGTEFNINNYLPERVQVSLVEGSVRMTAGRDSLQLSPGFEAIYQPSKGIKARSFDPIEVLSWRKGIIEFNNAALGDVLRTIPRWYGINVEVQDLHLSDRAFTGSLDRNKPIEHFLDLLKYTHNIQYEKQGDTIYIK